jgi:hypothetical protein
VRGKPTGKNPSTTAGPVGRLFFPQGKSLGIDRSQYSNALLSKITYAGSNNTSFQQAHADLEQLAELAVTDKQVRRVCKRIGAERVAERDAAAAAYQQLPLVQRKGAPPGVVAPDLGVVGADGGRLQIFERPRGAAAAAGVGPEADALETATARSPTVAGPVPERVAASGPGAAVASPEPDVVVTGAAAGATGPPGGAPAVAGPPEVGAPEERLATVGEEDDAEERRGRFWREDKIGVLLTMTSTVSEHDPCPEIPTTFLQPARMTKLVRELKKRAPPHEEAAKGTDEPEAGTEALRDNAARWQPPEVQAKQVVASRRPWSAFGPLLASAAWSLGFFAAPRKAFIGDGADNNWTLHRQLFSSFVPILDFIHGLSYVFAAAMAGRGFREGWEVYERWIQWVWSGAVDQVIAELTARQMELGAPAADEPAGSARAVVARALTYLQNNRERMHYANYRRQGLPITTSYVESTVKQMNYRVKGTEKFWTEEGAEELLQLRADSLSDGEGMPAFWKRREAKETGQNRYRRAE